MGGDFQDQANLYALAGHGASLLSVYLVEKGNNGFFLYRIDVLDKSIVSETWHPARQEAMDEAKSETASAMDWKKIPEGTRDSLSYIFDQEPRLALRAPQDMQKNTIPLAINLIWADFAVTTLISVIDYFSKTPVIAMSIPSMLPMDIISPGTFALLFAAVNLIFTLVMVFKISDGAKWGRNTYAVICLTTVVPTIFRLGEIFSQSKVIGMLSLIQAGLEIYATVLLYTGFGREWFGKTVRRA